MSATSREWASTSSTPGTTHDAPRPGGLPARRHLTEIAALQYLLGQVRRITRGKANPGAVGDLIRIQLDTLSIAPASSGPNPVRAHLVGARGQDAAHTPTQTRTRLGHVIGAYKSLTDVNYIRAVKTRNWQPFHKRLWQRNYYKHIVCSDESLLKMREYTLYNPSRWPSAYPTRSSWRRTSPPPPSR